MSGGDTGPATDVLGTTITPLQFGHWWSSLRCRWCRGPCFGRHGNWSGSDSSRRRLRNLNGLVAFWAFDVFPCHINGGVKMLLAMWTRKTDFLCAHRHAPMLDCIESEPEKRKAVLSPLTAKKGALGNNHGHFAARRYSGDPHLCPL